MKDYHAGENEEIAHVLAELTNSITKVKRASRPFHELKPE